MSFIRLNYYIVFATKRREPTIDLANERRVYALLFSIMKKYGATVFRIGGMPDHVHICVSIPPTIAVSDFVKHVKRESSLAIKQNSILAKWDGWQNGSGCFSYSKNDVDNIVNYIKGQKEHHRKRSFIDEYRAWLIENGVSSDEPYFPWFYLSDESFRFKNSITSFPVVSLRSATGYRMMNPYGFMYLTCSF